MTSKLCIAFKNQNLEIIAKIINSVACKYDCSVRYVAEENRLKFAGDKKCFRPIVEEMMAAFFPEPSIATVRINQKQKMLRKSSDR